MKIRVYYEDTDAGGIVYHSNYINFCERARSEAFFMVGRMPVLEDGHFVAKKLEADYIASARLGDLLEVKTSLIELKNASFTLLQEIFRDDEKLFSMKITLVFVGFDGKMGKIPPSEREFIKELK